MLVCCGWSLRDKVIKWRPQACEGMLAVLVDSSTWMGVVSGEPTNEHIRRQSLQEHRAENRPEEQGEGLRSRCSG